MNVFERLIERGRLLMSRMEKQVQHGVESLPEAERVVEGEDVGWLTAAAAAMDREFGPESQEALNYRKAMEAELERVRELMDGGVRSTHGDWNIWLIGYAIGLLAPYQYHPDREGAKLRGRDEGPPAISIGSLHVGDEYSASQAGAMGPHAQARHMTFQQLWGQLQAATDLPILVRELDALRKAMKSDAISTEHDVAIGEVATAQGAASAGDGPKALQHLKSAGKWALDTATKIGVTVAAKVIEAAMDLP